MKLAALVLVLVAACQAGGGDDYPPGPGGGGRVIGGNGNGGGGSDAGTGDGGDAGDGDAGVQITGRVCILKDLRTLTVCDDAVDASALTVSIGTSRSVHPSARGSFTIAAPLGTFSWHVTGRDFITSVAPLESQILIPVISDLLYLDLLRANSVTISELQGSAILRVVRGVTAVAAVNATSNPAANNLAFYDGTDSVIWDNDINGTGRLGIVWLPGLTLTTNPTIVSVTLTPPLGAASVTKQVAVEDQAITFVTTDLP
jgi:hypothetical protein